MQHIDPTSWFRRTRKICSLLLRRGAHCRAAAGVQRNIHPQPRSNSTPTLNSTWQRCLEPWEALARAAWAAEWACGRSLNSRSSASVASHVEETRFDGKHATGLVTPWDVAADEATRPSFFFNRCLAGTCLFSIAGTSTAPAPTNPNGGNFYDSVVRPVIWLVVGYSQPKDRGFKFQQQRLAVVVARRRRRRTSPRRRTRARSTMGRLSSKSKSRGIFDRIRLN